MGKGKVVLLALLAAVLLAWCGWQQPGLVEQRERDKLTPESAIAGTPSTVAFTTILLGGFRGVLSDVLWLRVTRLQDEGRYFELVQLSDWITKLEPRSTGTWAFHAWNMAYNVSVMMADPAERWQWVKNGIRLLRDEGLRYNPDDARLHFELGWLFQHKIGTHIDPAWLYYQERLAVDVDGVLPGGRLPVGGEAVPADTAQALRAQFGLGAARMRKIDQQFGPLDWRLPESHALYWADEGLRRSGKAHDLLCERMRYQCLAVSFVEGQLTLNQKTGTFLRAARPDLLDHVLNAYDRALAGPNARLVRESYVNFLGGAIDVLKQSGRVMDAERVRALYDRQSRLLAADHAAAAIAPAPPHP